ncbi:MAG: hypothetical protein LUC43_05950 [Burkholderiales bacterium]|nr:hypothetical protein [Burkholderiales bacterium]
MLVKKDLDGWLHTKTKVVIEQKSYGIDLLKPELQLGGTTLTPISKLEDMMKSCLSSKELDGLLLVTSMNFMRECKLKPLMKLLQALHPKNENLLGDVQHLWLRRRFF